jgi:crotonobetainyl-CoA:carnitine CoA-transferase CaiB-like acyl-CoA transferase
MRVLECGDAIAAAYAGRLLCDLGADVVKVEPPAGDPLRALGPFVGGIPNRDQSASFGYFHAGKTSAMIRPDEHRVALTRLMRGAEVVIRSNRADRVSPSDELVDELVDEVTASRPDLIVVEISTYGRQGPRRSRAMSDLLALAAGGLLSVNATSPTDPDAPPLRYRGEMASIHAACDAVVAVLGALHERHRSGAGQRIDVSAQAAVAAVLGTGVARYGYQRQVPVHNGTRSVAPWGFYQCADGLVLIQCTEDEEWHRLLHLLGDPDWGQLEIFRTTAQREQVTDVLDMYVGQALSSMKVADFVAAAYRSRVPAAPIHSAADVLAWEHLRERGFFQTIRLTDGRHQHDLPVPSPPWRFRHTQATARGASPRLGDHRWDDIWTEAVLPPPLQADPAPAGPLAGIRVIDLTWVWAGPYGTMQLAHLGAEVIKIESSRRVDVTRRLGPYADDVMGINRSGYFNQYNQGKKSVTLNLKDRRAVDLLKRLAATADVIVDNMRSGALARLGLSYDRLRCLNPKVVAVSMTGFGETGPEHDRVAYGSLIDAMSGTATANGTVGGGPTDFPMSLPDPVAGIHMVIATVAALYRARVTGVGERVECSMLEACVAAFPWPVLFQAAVGCEAPVLGNRDEQRSPHEVYRCAEKNRWVAVAVEDDQQFRALAAAIGQPGLADDPRFATVGARRIHEEELNRIIADWAAGHPARLATERMQEAGVPAEEVATVDALFDSCDLLDRDFFLTHDHPEVGRRPLAGVAWTTSRSPMVAAAAAPVLGQHTHEVLGTALGLSDDELDVLERDGVVV